MSSPARAALALTLLTILASRATAAPADRGDLAVRARAIFLKHCAECHGQNDPRAGLPLLDYARVTTGDWPVPIVKPAQPDASLLLQLVQEGSMPPGDRPKLAPDELKALEDWVKAQAPGYPARFDEEFALTAILADVGRLGAQAGKVRYVSFQHLLADDANPHPVGQYRTALAHALSVLGIAADALKPIEPTETVFHLDLLAARLDQTPFTRVLADQTAQVADDFNLFDLILLEYPDGRLPGQAPTEQRLTAEFLRPAKQVRPVTYVRGDWLAFALSGGRLAEDLRKILKAPLAKELPPPRPVEAPVAGIRILPLDAVGVPALTPPGGPYRLTVQVVNKATGQKQTVFRPGAEIVPEIRTDPDHPVFLEVYFKSINAGPARPDLRPNDDPLLHMFTQQTQEGKPRHEFPLVVREKDQPEHPYRLDEKPGQFILTVYACEKPFPPGEILTGPFGIERIVHRFYPLAPEPGGVNPARVEKKTATFEVRK